MEATATEATHIHIFVGKMRIEFDTNVVTGLQIKSAAGVPAESDLAQRVQGELKLVTNDQKVEIKNGDHFEVLPPGSIS